MALCVIPLLWRGNEGGADKNKAMVIIVVSLPYAAYRY